MVAVKGGYATFEANRIRAYYQAEQTGKVYVQPPAEHMAMRAPMGLDTDIVWKLHWMLPGHRAAGAGLVPTASKRFLDQGFDLPEVSDKVLIEVHMDDMHGCSPSPRWMSASPRSLSPRASPSRSI